MGLAAGQARLLSITARKSDCEFQSMRLSHQKIAMARELADLSNEYQDSLQMTKLVYDYYGTGDTSMPLSYSLMMSPSALNDYMPITVTDSLGRVTLNSKLASAARAAGIPQEGLGCLPSEVMRNLFVLGLAKQGVITENLANKITALPYNQAAGFGGGATVATQTEQGNYDEFVEMLKNSNGNAFTMITKGISCTNCKGKGDEAEFAQIVDNDRKYNGTDQEVSTQMSLAGLLGDEHQYYLEYRSPNGEQTPVIGLALMQSQLGEHGGFIDWLADEFAAVLDLGDGYTASALEYAKTKTREIYVDSDITNRDHWISNINSWDWSIKDQDSKIFSTNEGGDAVNKYIENIGTTDYNAGHHHKDVAWSQDSRNYIGYRLTANKQEGWHDDGYDKSTASVNLNNIAKVFLTYFADYVNGVSKTDSHGIEEFDINFDQGQRQLDYSHMSQNNKIFQYTWKIGSDISSDDLGHSKFYDALFNQICAHGWTENDHIEQNDYLREMLQNGMQFISKVKDDGYYYQGNYATDAYIKEVADETAIAKAEAKYSTEKAKLNAKEETIDMKMKNLDTEISSLTTEYDTVKSTVSKNIEKSFKRYNA